jgi:MFS family permease
VHYFKGLLRIVSVAWYEDDVAAPFLTYEVGMYIFARMVLGFGIVFCIISGSSLIGELGHPKDRATLTSLFNSSYFLGAIVAAVITIKTVDIPGDWSWRVPSLLQMCPSLLQICTIL